MLLDFILSNAILVMCSYATKSDSLCACFAIVRKRTQCKTTIVSVIVLDFYVSSRSKMLVIMFGLDCRFTGLVCN